MPHRPSRTAAGSIPAPAGPTEIFAGIALPVWVTSDWTLAVLAAFVFLGGVFAAGAVHGALLGLTAHGLDAIGLGAIAGAYIPFAAPVRPDGGGPPLAAVEGPQGELE